MSQHRSTQSQSMREWDGDPDSRWFSWTIGLVVGSGAYGALCTLCVLIFISLQERAKQERRKYGRLYAETTWMFLYIFYIFILCSGLLAAEIEASLPHAPVPHRPKNVFQNILSGVPPSIVGIACSSLIHWGVEVLFVSQFSFLSLMWRCYVIYRNSTSTKRLLLSFMGLVFIVSVGSGILFLIKVIMEEFQDSVLLLTIYGATSLVSNLIFTHIIVIRLYLYRRHVIQLVGRQYASHYTSIMSMFIESGLLMNVVIALSLVPIAMRSNWVALPLLTFSLTEALSSYVIVFKVAVGSAWSSGTASKLIAQHTVGIRSTTLPPDERLSAMRYRVTPQGTQISTGFRFNHEAASSNILASQHSSRQSSIRVPERCRTPAKLDG